MGVSIMAAPKLYTHTVSFYITMTANNKLKGQPQSHSDILRALIDNGTQISPKEKKILKHLSLTTSQYNYLKDMSTRTGCSLSEIIEILIGAL